MKKKFIRGCGCIYIEMPDPRRLGRRKFRAETLCQKHKEQDFEQWFARIERLQWRNILLNGHKAEDEANRGFA
jgi:hypothetical protein